MNASDRDSQGRCKYSQDLLNQLTVIVICCDLLRDEPDEQAENLRRLSLIRNAARSVAEELSRHQCDYEEAALALRGPRPQFVS